MTPLITSIVEGHGEVEGFAVLLRRIALERCGVVVDAAKPHRVPRDKLIHRPAELARAVELQTGRVHASGTGGLVVLVDADDDSPDRLSSLLEAGAAPSAGSVPTVAVVAVREYEAWFLAGVESLRAHRAVLDDAEFVGDPEAPRDAKGRLEKMMSVPYDSVRHQAAFNALLDIGTVARRSPSFQRLVDAVTAMVGV